MSGHHGPGAIFSHAANSLVGIAILYWLISHAHYILIPIGTLILGRAAYHLAKRARVR